MSREARKVDGTEVGLQIIIFKAIFLERKPEF